MKFTRNILNDSHSYGWGPVLMHWLVATSIIGLYPLGLYIVDLDYYDPAYRILPEWHKLFGILVAALLVLRILWRGFNKPPQPLPQPAWQITAAHVTHKILYLLLVVTVVSGYMISTADGRAIEPFGLFSLPAYPLGIEDQEDIAGVIHEYSATLIIVLAALHAGAALKHHFIDKDITLKRIFGLRENIDEN